MVSIVTSARENVKCKVCAFFPEESFFNFSVSSRILERVVSICFHPCISE